MGAYYNPWGYGGYGGYWGRGYVSPFGGYGYGYGGNVYGNVYSNEIVDSTAVAPEAYVSAPSDEAEANEFLDRARIEFQNQNYEEAARLANHAVIDMPENAKAHEMMSLALFAQGEFRGAAAAAHAAAHLGSVPDWPTLYGYYNDRDVYAAQLQQLQTAAQENADVAEIQFLLGMHQLMMGHNDSARNQFADYLKLVRYDDPVGVQLYGQAGGDVNALPKPDPVSAPVPPRGEPQGPTAPAETESEPRT